MDSYSEKGCKYLPDVFPDIERIGMLSINFMLQTYSGVSRKTRAILPNLQVMVNAEADGKTTGKGMRNLQ